MLLSSYTKEIFRSKCHSEAQSVHCHASLSNDIGKALPYLNGALGGFSYTDKPPSVTFKVHGKLITVHSKKIAINALKDADEADKILEWLKNEINDAWTNRKEITPCYQGVSKPGVLEILKLLPKTVCGSRDCKEPTCLVFAVKMTEGVKDVSDCPHMEDESRQKLVSYLARYRFID